MKRVGKRSDDHFFNLHCYLTLMDNDAFLVRWRNLYLIYTIIIRRIYNGVFDAKLKVLIFFLNALTDGSSFTCSGSAFQIHATVNAKLFLNIDLWTVGISKLNLEFRRL